MNPWIKKSFDLAGEDGYLDRLLAVYPMASNPIRKLSEESRMAIRSAMAAKDYKVLVKVLLKLERFPIKDSYVACLRRHPASIDKNPATIKRIGERLSALGADEVISLAGAPKETNTQLGPLFGKWLKSLGYAVLNERDFLEADEVATLNGSDNQLKEFINRNFGSNLKKGLDAVIRVGDKMVIAEAKFLSDYGGHQNAQFNDAMALLHHEPIAGVERVAILDGVLWLPNKQKMNKTIREEAGDAMSALLLPHYIDSLRRVS